MKRYIKSAIRNVGDEDEYTQMEIAWDSHTKGRQLDELVHSPHYDVQLAALENPNVNIQHLIAAANSSDPAFRAMAALNPSTPSDVLEMLSWDWSDQVICNVAGNPSTPADVLIRLLDHEDYMVRQKIGANPGITKDVMIEILDRWDSSSVSGLANNPNAPSEFLSELAKNSWDSIRCAVANNPNTDTETLKLLATDSYSSVKDAAEKQLVARGEVL